MSQPELNNLPHSGNGSSSAANKRKFVSLETYFDTPPSSPAPLVEAWPSSYSSGSIGPIETSTLTPRSHTSSAGGGIEGLGGGPGAASSIMPTSNSISMRLLGLAIHKALFGLFLGTFLYSIYVDVTRGRYNLLANYIYLTHWNLSFQVVFTSLELASDYSSAVAERTAAFRAKFFHSIVAPYSFFVCASFWGMVAVDEGLVRPSDLEDRCEEWYNQVVHTLIVPAALLEGLANYHRPSPLPEAFSITLVCGVIYAFWSIMWGILFDLWSYELFRALTFGGFLLLVAGSGAALVTFNLLGRTVHEAVWRSQRMLDARHQQYVLARMQQAQAAAHAQAMAALNQQGR
ncbi:Androgen-induced protein 1 protein [Tyrophagus putrescentiae]|nr:Androgen-induced protein 1 protein [Tyrophagus putrescentiae]